MLVVRRRCCLAIIRLLLHVVRLSRHAEGVHAAWRRTSHGTLTGLLLLSLLVTRRFLAILSLGCETRTFGTIERPMLSSNELSSTLFAKSAWASGAIRLVGRHLREKACLGQLSRLYLGRITHFGCIAVLDGNCGARVLAEQPCVVLPASSGRFRKVFLDSAGRHNSSVRWKLDEMEI